MESTEQYSTQSSSSNTTRALRIILRSGFVVAAILIAYLTYVAERDFVALWEITNLPGVSLQESNPPASAGEAPGGVQDINTPLQSPGGPTPEPWDGVKPVTVQAVDVRAGQLLITAHDPSGTRIRIAADRLPNFDVAVQLVRLLGQVP